MEDLPFIIQDQALVKPTNGNDRPTSASKDVSEHSPAIEHRPQAPTILDENGLPLSKNRLKKLKKDQDWEANRAKRKAKRKEKDQEKKQRKRDAVAAASAAAIVRKEGAEPEAKKVRLDPELSVMNGGELIPRPSKQNRSKHIQLPVTLVLDCGFDDLMTETEIKSLGCQVTRSYSECHRAPYQAHLMACSWGGRLRERFEGVLAGSHKSWKGVTFLEEGFVVAAERARGLMMRDDKEEEGGGGGRKMAGAFAKYAGDDGEESRRVQLKEEEEKGEVVYLTSDSENTLSELRPYSTYIIGGLVDKNRHKGICYKRAMDKGVRTAKLPIGEYMQMQSRSVLATNHVVEIMLKWLECGDWGEAFVRVIPKRKGGSLRVGRGDDGEGTKEADNSKEEVEEEEEGGSGRQEGGAVDVKKAYQDAADKYEELAYFMAQDAFPE